MFIEQGDSVGPRILRHRNLQLLNSNSCTELAPPLESLPESSVVINHASDPAHQHQVVNFTGSRNAAADFFNAFPVQRNEVTAPFSFEYRVTPTKCTPNQPLLPHRDLDCSFAACAAHPNNVTVPNKTCAESAPSPVNAELVVRGVDSSKAAICNDVPTMMATTSASATGTGDDEDLNNQDLSNNEVNNFPNIGNIEPCSMETTPSRVSPTSFPSSEPPDCLAHRLLMEFGKTRTNYNSLVPRIVDVMRIYRDFGPARCPIPVVSNLDDLLNDDALLRIESRYPTSIDAGFLVLCTERRALRSGGGGKYYFIDVKGRLVGCHKADLPHHYEENNMKGGPVLLKNLIFVFVMRGAYGLDPRCKSSNPQRLLEFYETLSKDRKAGEIQRLMRVWSMEVHAEAPYDDGFPPCTLLWLKRMNIAAHITRWKQSQWRASQARKSHLSQHPVAGTGPIAYNRNLDQRSSIQGVAPAFQAALARQGRRRRSVTAPRSSTGPYDIPWGNNDATEKEYLYGEVNSAALAAAAAAFDPYDSSNPQMMMAMLMHHEHQQLPPRYDQNGMPVYSGEGGATFDSAFDTAPSAWTTSVMRAADFAWDAPAVSNMYSNFNELAAVLSPQDAVEWALHIAERLEQPLLGAAAQLLKATFKISTHVEMPPSNSLSAIDERNSGLDESSTKSGLAFTRINENSARLELSQCIQSQDVTDKLEALRILFACLVQQQRLSGNCSRDGLSLETASTKSNSSSVPVKREHSDANSSTTPASPKIDFATMPSSDDTVNEAMNRDILLDRTKSAYDTSAENFGDSLLMIPGDTAGLLLLEAANREAAAVAGTSDEQAFLRLCGFEDSQQLASEHFQTNEASSQCQRNNGIVVRKSNEAYSVCSTRHSTVESNSTEGLHCKEHDAVSVSNQDQCVEVDILNEKEHRTVPAH